MHRFELSANCALSASEAWMFFWLVAVSSLFVAGVFVAMGYWPILPFAGLEIGLLGWALQHHWRRAQDRESVTIDDDQITISRWYYKQSRPSNIQLPRAWTRAALIAEPGGSQLALGQRNHWCVIGRFLVESEKRALKARISQVLRQTGHKAANAASETQEYAGNKEN